MMDDDEKITMEKGNTKLVLQHDVDENELLWHLKDREPPPERYRVDVFIDGKKVATYARTFETHPTTEHLNNFLKKLARDPGYRKQYFVLGSMIWNGIVVWDEPVNPKTRTAIARLNHASMTKLRFKDFARLKVGGRDGFSGKGEEDLDGIIGEQDATLVNDAFPDDGETRATAKRWVARGLHVLKAIRKVKTDAEIRENATSGRRR